jgi:ABC-type sugar transport system ATPase subunit
MAGTAAQQFGNYAGGHGSAMSNKIPVLSARSLSKQYGPFLALDRADLDLWSGQVHALVGSNGAGKSTLVKILTGALTPDSGDLLINGKRTHGDTKTMLDAGVACIYQEAQLVPALSVLDNILLGRQPINRFGLLKRKAQRENVAALLSKYDLRLDLDNLVQTLTPVQQKEVEIVKALSLNAQIILMDEPTASLSHAEVTKLFETIQRLREQGVAILYISHILDEIFTIADQVTVIRDGKVRLTLPVSEISKKTLIDTMLGQELTHELTTESRAARQQSRSTEPEVALECRGFSKNGLFENINLKLYSGEVLCLTGLVGAKRSELVRAIFGAEPADRGELFVYGKPVEVKHPIDAIRLKIGFVPEDRRRDGLFMGLSMALNIIMAHLSSVSRMGLMFQSAIRAVGGEQLLSLNIVPPRLDITPRALSGGNQQKVLLGRWLTGDTRIIILDEPTVGIDVGTKAAIYALLRKLAASNKAILMVSSDMEEVLTVADRVVVMAQGRITATLDHEQISQERILKAASGEQVELSDDH